MWHTPTTVIIHSRNLLLSASKDSQASLVWQDTPGPFQLLSDVIPKCLHTLLNPRSLWTRLPTKPIFIFNTKEKFSKFTLMVFSPSYVFCVCNAVRKSPWFGSGASSSYCIQLWMHSNKNMLQYVAFNLQLIFADLSPWTARNQITLYISNLVCDCTWLYQPLYMHTGCRVFTQNRN